MSADAGKLGDGACPACGEPAGCALTTGAAICWCFELSPVMPMPPAGTEALLIRTQLIVPDNDVLNADQFNRLFTMHGVSMVFMVVMPMSAAFFNLLIPLMIGARDVAFPRLNALSYWLFLLGGLVLF